jgi:hypothetical protein
VSFVGTADYNFSSPYFDNLIEMSLDKEQYDQIELEEGP